ncbi:MAG: efflux RND transporter permease subunit [Longimicrobiales bacterium]
MSIRRPVAVAMAYLGVALLGLAAWQNVPIELLPDEQLPRLSVTADWPGASPETVEAFLTSPVESAIQLVRGVEKVTSTSSEGQTEIDVEFDRETDMDFARLDLSERLATLEETQLPPGAGQVLVSPYVPPEFAEQSAGFLTYTFTGARTLEALREHLEEVVEPELSRIEGVAVVRTYGGRDRVLEVELNPEQMAALGLTPAMVQTRIGNLDLVREAGAVRADSREWTVTVQNRPESVRDVLDAVVIEDGGRLVRVSDVATVRDTYEDARSHYRVNGRPAVQMQLTKEIGTNTVRVADRVKERMVRVEARSPPNTQFILDRDESREIRRQMSDLRSRALVSAVVIFFVLMLFLRSFRSAGVVFATIAFSIMIALNLIYFLGLSLNLLTLMGLAMGFGLIVDNSIVVLENVYRRWQAGDTPEAAATEGTSEVVLPIMAATATTLIVFVPFVYLQNELRVFYVPLAIVVALTLVSSLLVAFSFIPALAGKILPATRDGARPDRSTALSGRKPPLYERFYRWVVSLTLAWPWAAVVLAAAGLGGSYHLFDKYVTRGVVWGGAWGQETRIDIQIQLPRGSDLERTDELTRFFEDRLRGLPEVERFVAQINERFAQIRVTFPEELEQTQVPVAIKDQLFAYSLGFSGAEVRVYGYGPSFYGGGGGAPNYSIQVLGYNYEEVRDIAENIGTRLSRQSRVREVNTNATSRFFDRERASEFAVVINRDALARYDLTVDETVNQIRAAIRGQYSNNSLKFQGDEVRYDVKLEGNRDMDLVELREALMNTPSGQPIRLAELVRIEPRDVLARILREDQQYQRRVSYEFRGPQKLGDLVHDAVIDATEVGPGYTVKKADSLRWSDEERSQIYLVLALSVLLIYMVTAALFESLVLPLCVLLTVPMALIGVFLIFFYSGANFTREAYIGVIMMGGIVVNNAILLVDHVGRVRRAGNLSLDEAILEGTMERVRPILMTTTTTVLGLLPLVLFSDGANANIWNALAYALIGGLLSSTLLVLTATPALYLLFERRRQVEHPVHQATPLAPLGAEG